MDENKTNEEPESTVEDSNAGSESKSYRLIEDANLAAKRLEEANTVQAELLARQTELYAQQKLGGQSEAGLVKEKPKPLTPKEYSEALERGEVDPMKEDGIKV